MKDWLYPGAKVVCANAGPIDDTPGIDPQGLVHGRIYTIRWVGKWRYEIYGEAVSVRLVEYVRDETDTPVGAVRFRPLTKRSTDAEVSKLKRLLNTTPADLEKVDG